MFKVVAGESFNIGYFIKDPSGNVIKAERSATETLFEEESPTDGLYQVSTVFWPTLMVCSSALTTPQVSYPPRMYFSLF